MILEGYLGLPCHHESGEVSSLVLGQHINARIDAETDECKQETSGYERETPTGPVTQEGQYQQHDRTRYVRRDCIQVGLDSAVAQPADHWRKEELHRLKRHAQADLYRENHPACRVLEDLEGVTPFEVLVDNRRTVDLHTVEGELLLLFVQEPGS